MTAAVCYPEKYPVEEMFQLLRIPWEWYVEGTRYDVAIARRADIPGYTGPLLNINENEFFRKIADRPNLGEMHLHEPSCDIELDRVRQVTYLGADRIVIPGTIYDFTLTWDGIMTQNRLVRGVILKPSRNDGFPDIPVHEARFRNN